MAKFDLIVRGGCVIDPAGNVSRLTALWDGAMLPLD